MAAKGLCSPIVCPQPVLFITKAQSIIRIIQRFANTLPVGLARKVVFPFPFHYISLFFKTRLSNHGSPSASYTAYADSKYIQSCPDAEGWAQILGP